MPREPAAQVRSPTLAGRCARLASGGVQCEDGASCLFETRPGLRDALPRAGFAMSIQTMPILPGLLPIDGFDRPERHLGLRAGPG